MVSQWNCVLQNLGEWHGSFTHFSPGGDERDDIPSVITLEGLDGNRAIHLVLKRFYSETDGDESRWHELAMTFSEPGVGSLFFESGAFSIGPRYASPSLKFGAEFCFVTHDQRSRQVQSFDTTGRCQQVTLIREKRADSTVIERPQRPVEPQRPVGPQLAVGDLLGTWQQQSVTLYPGRPESPEPSNATVVRLSRTPDQFEWVQQVSVLDDSDASQGSALEPNKTVVSQLTPSLICFEQDGHHFQTVLLPDGAFSTYPVQLQSGHPFFVEAGWLVQPDVCQRLIRRYSASGDWVNVTLSIETRR